MKKSMIKYSQKEHTMSLDELKLVTEIMAEKDSPDHVARTRMNNWRSVNAVSTYFSSHKIKEIMTGFGLPANPAHADETNEFYEAMAFFKNNEDYFKDSLAMKKIMDLFSWSEDDYKEYLSAYMAGDLTNKDMLGFKDLDLRKIAKAFAEGGPKDLSEQSVKKDKAYLESIDKAIAKMLIEWKKDIIDYGKDGEKD